MNKAIKILLSQAVNSFRLCGIKNIKCPNQLVGTVKITTKRNTRSVQWKSELQTDHKPVNTVPIFDRQEIDKGLSKRNLIILVLESPHISEFSDEGIPKGPAFGSSGFYINKYFAKILEKTLNNNNMNLQLSDGCYDLAIVNAIRYQCSLGVDTLLFRDAVFLSKWEKQRYRDSFIRNLCFLANESNNYLVINCCTKGHHLDLLTTHKGGVCKEYLEEIGYDYKDASSFSLKAFVSDEIKKAGIVQFYCAHPSSWYSKRNRKIRDNV